ncbi:spore maturation protein [Kyrpidia tusciae]|uniref:Nucleoside recognition domain protein n=1 Tax=Kyrpidia tusciae (strain DSM 2912 / NBRC 15312 / T2) TaxID=562970 RepID=D5WQA6_KYRT2|nr:nucleoside recognition domain-containing protein [Kyrpidia tusciae]ADG06515.1 nucleoside recognition domain protein [Kyrpidia tusciae DSM 2912]
MNGFFALSAWMLPTFFVGTVLWAALRRVPVYETFVAGAKDGFETAVRIIPHLVGMMVAIRVFRDSGALEWITGLVAQWISGIFPAEVLPMLFLRPISGTGSLTYMIDVLRTHGGDSWPGRLASTIQGSTDTTLYVITVYFGSVGIRKVRYALKVGLLSDLVSAAASAVAVWVVFGPPG